jgi:hypothetical protein
MVGFHGLLSLSSLWNVAAAMQEITSELAAIHVDPYMHFYDLKSKKVW